MSEFERLLDEYADLLSHWDGVGHVELKDARAALLAYHERVVRERYNWEETAARHLTSETFYRVLLDGIGRLFPDCYVSDDGSVQDQPLALKVKECVQAALAERDARIAELEPDAERYRWLQTAGMFRCDADMSGRHHWMGLGRNIGRGHSLDEAIDAARKAKEEP